MLGSVKQDNVSSLLGSCNKEWHNSSHTIHWLAHSTQYYTQLERVTGQEHVKRHSCPYMVILVQERANWYIWMEYLDSICVSVH